MSTTIALLSDVHANWPALEAVLLDARKFQYDEVWFLGDFTGYSPYPNEVVQALRKLKAVCIIGNYDLKVLDFLKLQTKWQGKKDPAKYFSFAWTQQHLGIKEKKYLRELPERRRLKVEGQKFLLVHGSPYGIEDPLVPGRDKNKFQKIIKDFKVQAVLCGHTHLSFAIRKKGVWFINPGSIGRSFDGDPSASYAVMEVTAQKIIVTPRRVKYSLSALKARMIRKDFPAMLIKSVTKARSVDYLRKEK